MDLMHLFSNFDIKSLDRFSLKPYHICLCNFYLKKNDDY